MDRPSLDRRQFQQLLGAAFGGLVTGATLGCGGDDQGSSSGSAAGSPSAAPSGTTLSADAVASLKHACRGLNACKGQGADAKNACAGQGTCANVKPHSCATQNECKGLGGCGKLAGANECKGQGSCEVPLHEGAWETARAHFEKKMKELHKDFGPAPEKKS